MASMQNRVVIFLLLVMSVGGVRFGQKNSALRTSLGHQAQQQQQHQQHQQQLLQRAHRERTVRGGTTGSEGEGTRLFSTNMTSANGSGIAPARRTTAPSERVLILDVDGTLYGQSSGVEQQIVREIHRFFGQELGLSPEECDEIHNRHGSTVGGLQKEGRLTARQVERYYEEVFSSINVRGLYETAAADDVDRCVEIGDAVAGDGGRSGDATGYQHRSSAAAMIRAHRGPVFVASNSPEYHVRRVLEAVGLADVPLAGLLTPDTREYITKSLPEFYDPILEHSKTRGLKSEDLWLLDDSPANLKVASLLGMRTVGVDGDAGRLKGSRRGYEDFLPLDRAMACFVGAIPHRDDWKFEDDEYLRSKNVVDRESRSQEVWRQLADQVLALDLGADDTLRVVDLGCGLMPLLQDFRDLAKACGARRLEYCGLEKEADVASEAVQELCCEGYTRSSSGVHEMWQLLASGDAKSGPPETLVRVIAADFVDINPADLFPQPPQQPRLENTQTVETREQTATSTGEYPRPHVLVGCCLADLLPPDVLLRALAKFAGCETGGGSSSICMDGVGEGGGKGGAGGEGGTKCLVYLPITFVGKTDVVPAAPEEGLVPADAAVLQAYDDCLREEQGHYTSLETLLKTIREHGGDGIVSSPSHWKISFDAHSYMWRCLLYFIALGVAPRPPPVSNALPSPATADDRGGSVADQGDRGQTWGRGEEVARADFAGWVERMRETAPTLEAHNVDVLFRLGGGGGGTPSNVGDAASTLRGGSGDKPAPHAEHRLRRWRQRVGNAPPSSQAGVGDASSPFPVGGEAVGQVSSSSPAWGKGVGDVPLWSPVGGWGGVRTPLARRAARVAGVSRGGGADGASPGGDDRASSPPTVLENEFLEFLAPGKVAVRREELRKEQAVGEGQVLVEAICSSISSGTELKVFRGDFDSDSELDTTIKGMAGESMSYPLKYGYSLVGRVATCGRGVDAKKFLGKLVFAFSPHSRWVVADADGGVMLVPEGIEPEDAVYLPAVETALSLVHDVHPRIGESVAVFGQGMIGLLAVAILAKTHGAVGGGAVVAVDMLPDRLKVSERLGATAAVTPSEAGELAPFDISLEVTGNPRGLQSALDLTGYGGRVVLGSWYGGGTAKLNLGMAFHRSHLTLQTSQVSKLQAGMTDRWDKERRFAAAWALVRELRPSGFLTTSSPGLDGAQAAYESLGAGGELGVVFRY